MFEFFELEYEFSKLDLNYNIEHNLLKIKIYFEITTRNWKLLKVFELFSERLFEKPKNFKIFPTCIRISKLVLT